jgi:2-amino-4-hydroxy-6-hydroxymethyldihydropteridine diphosphokinase/dihydropteroate synthase
MHSLAIPSRKDIIIANDRPPINIIMDWASKNIEHLLSLGFKPESIIIDPGIGFSKSPYQDIELMRHTKQLKSLGSPILIGHSRKSYMESFTKQEAKNRDLETIAISALLADKADFLRVHNVADHMRFFVAQQAFLGGDRE